MIQIILSSPCEKLHNSPFIFERTETAASHNSRIIMNHKGNLDNLMQSLKYSFTHYGSEFRSINLLEKLLSGHSKWPKLKSIILHGTDYPLDPITEKERLEDIEFHIQRGNHKSATSSAGLLSINKAYDKEVKFGWQVPILPSIIKHIKHACIAPLGIAEQWSFNEKNQQIKKQRVTHDCSFPGPSGKSTNLRIPDNLLEECTFGFCLLRLLHSAHQMRFRHTNTRILSSKSDMNSAYRRLHATLKAASSCITIIDKIAYILFRLPFGASPAVGLFSILSDITTDLTTEIAEDVTWNPDELHSDLFEQQSCLLTSHLKTCVLMFILMT